MTTMSGTNSFPGNFAAAELGVFWDVSECEIPDGVNGARMLGAMRRFISDSGHRGHVTIHAYGDLRNHHFPSDAGVKLNHFPAGERYAKETKMLEDIIAWSGENPEPSTLMLITATGSGSDDLLDVVKLLKRQKNYQLICINSPPPPTVVILIPTSSGGGN